MGTQSVPSLHVGDPYLIENLKIGCNTKAAERSFLSYILRKRLRGILLHLQNTNFMIYCDADSKPMRILASFEALVRVGLHHH
jgi:hypothetical protein